MPEINTRLTSRTLKLITKIYKNKDSAMTQIIFTSDRNLYENYSLQG